MNIESIITKIPYWDNLSDDEKTRTIRGTSFYTYEKDAYIYGLEDACLGMVYIEKGSIRVYITSEEGREVTLFHISEGECCILSASCVIGEISLDVQLTAETQTEVLAIHAGTFQEIMENNLNVKCFAFELATKRFSAAVWVMQQILFAHFDERMARLLLAIYEKTGEKKIKMTQEAMAQEVNSAREVVARMLRQFADDGLIEIERGAITLIDIDALENLIK